MATKCVVCKEGIGEGASYCPHCGHYQSRWKNNLKFFSSIAGFITLIASGIIFSVSIFPAAFDVLFPEKAIEILSYSDDNRTRHYSIHNKTRSDIWVRDIGIEVDGQSYLRESALTEKVAAGEIQYREQKFSHPDNEQPSGRFFFMLQVPPSEWSRLIMAHPTNCYSVTAWLAESAGPRIQELVDSTYGKQPGMIKTMVTFDYYLAATGEWLKAEAPVIAYLVRHNHYCDTEGS